MINVTDTIKMAYEQSTTQYDKIILDNKEYYIDNVQYCDDCYLDGNIFGTAIARTLDFEIENIVDLEKKEFEYLTGIKTENGIEWISLGNFITQEVDPDELGKVVTVSAMDYMLKSNVEYKTELDYSSGKVTILQVLQEACQNAGLILATTEFANADFIVDSNQFSDGSLIRQVFQAVAQISGTFAKIRYDNKLYFITPKRTGLTVREVHTMKVKDLNKLKVAKLVGCKNKIGPSDYSELTLKRNTHPINLVSLGMSNVEGENVVLRDEESIEKDGENSLVINDNPFAYTQAKREQLITALFNVVKGFKYTSFEIVGQSKPYMETGDEVIVVDTDGTYCYSFLFRFNYKSRNGLESEMSAPSIIKATVNYQNVLEAIDIAKRTEIIVDKQNQKIEAISSQQTTDKKELQNAIGATQEEFDKFVDETYKNQMSNIQAQIDGQIQSYFYDYEPTLTNVPASEWTTEDDKIKHMGDLFYNSKTGLGYRFSYIDNTWVWEELKDTDVGRALANAENALNVANNKRRVFVVQPTPPYDVGDLWITDNKELKSCIVAKNIGDYEETDWQDFVYKEQIENANELINTVNESVAQLTIEKDNIKAEVSETITRLENDYMTTEQVEAENQTMKDDLDIIKQQQASMELTSSGLQIQIDEINNNGVKTVKNTTVDIDENGVTVGKSDSEFSTTMSNTGTYMYSYDKQIAKYDKDGAEMYNLTVQNEAIIGNLRCISVDVDGEKRTHIHWIGG